MNGTSMPSLSARSANILAARTPSATITISSNASSSDNPEPSFSPIRRFLPTGEVEVTNRSPIPAGPKAVSARAPSCGSSRQPSRKPAVNIAAFRLSPPSEPIDASPSTSPQARATTFLKAPHNSAPTGSLAACRTRFSVDNVVTNRSAMERS